MTKNELVERIKAQYLPVEKNKLDELKALDGRVRRPAEIFAYSFGAAGSLVLGTGMCLSMKIISNLMPLGIVVGALGIAMVAANYYLYKKILKRRKNKYAKEVLTLSNEILGE